jgi:hypothetical protein
MTIKDQINLLVSCHARLEDLGTETALAGRNGIPLDHLSAALYHLDLVRMELLVIENQDRIAKEEERVKQSGLTVMGLKTNIAALKEQLSKGNGV